MIAGASALAGCNMKNASPPAPATAALKVEVWHDLICPWCYIGLHNLGRALDGWQGPAVEVALHPYLLNPDMPPEGRDLRADLARKYPQATPDEMFARVTQAGAAHGVRFDWDKVRTAPDTAPGHALIAAAPAGRWRALVEALHHAYFQRGENLGDAGVLAAVAASAGVDAATSADPVRLAEVRARAARATAAGLRGVPHFRVGAQTLHGAQSPEALRRALQAAAG